MPSVIDSYAVPECIYTQQGPDPYKVQALLDIY